MGMPSLNTNMSTSSTANAAQDAANRGSEGAGNRSSVIQTFSFGNSRLAADLSNGGSLPTWIWYAAGGVVLVGAGLWFYLRRKSA